MGASGPPPPSPFPNASSALSAPLWSDLWLLSELRTSSTEAWAVYLRGMGQWRKWGSEGVNGRVDGRHVRDELAAVLADPLEGSVHGRVELTPGKLLGEEEVEAREAASTDLR